MKDEIDKLLDRATEEAARAMKLARISIAASIVAIVFLIAAILIRIS